MTACGGSGGTDLSGNPDADAEQPPASGQDGEGDPAEDSGSSAGKDAPLPSDFTYDSTARFNTPSSLALDEAGNLYVMDDGNNTSRRIAASGSVSTLPGSFASGMIAERTGADGHLHLLSERLLYRISPAGEQTAIREFGSGPGSYSPTYVASDTLGNAYVLMQYRQLHEIWRIGASGHAVTVYAGGTSGSIAAIASDSEGNLALAINGPEPGSSFIRYVPRCSQPAEADTPGVSTVEVAASELPSSMIMDDAGNSYFSHVDTEINTQTGGYEYTGMQIFKVNTNGVAFTLLQGFPDSSRDRRPVLTGRPYVHAGLAQDSQDRIYFSDPRGHAIYGLNDAGNLSLIAGLPGQAGRAD